MILSIRHHVLSKVALVLAIGLYCGALPDARLDAQSRALRPIQVVEKRALLIGNAAYDHTRPLENTIADVRELQRALKELGFRTVIKENLTVDEMDEAVSEFAGELRPDDLALFYYSGHGMQVNSRNYLLPVDYRRGAVSSVRRRAIDAESVREVLESRARVRVLVLDACRNNPFGEGRSDVVGLARMSVQTEGTLVAYATGESNVASDNPTGRLGLYMTHFVDELRRETVELGDVFDRTQQRVYAASRGMQDPEIYDKVIGKVFLRGETRGSARIPELIVPEVTLPTEPTLSAAEAWAELQERWAGLEDSGNDEDLTTMEHDLKAFEEKYGGGERGTGVWVALALEKLKELPRMRAEREAVRFENEWRTALGAIKMTGSTEAANGFVSDYGHDPKALVALGDMYRSGEGLARDSRESARLYRSAAEIGDLAGMTKLGELHQAGDGVEQDPSAAVGWYREAAEGGYAASQALLGRMYELGSGVEQDFDEALSWYRRAAESGHSRGQAFLGWMYVTGRGVDTTFDEALEWCTLSAEQGDAAGQSFLGAIYENGLGVERDHDAAVALYRKAAEQGYAAGQAFLGRMYESGHGLDVDLDEARAWYRKAADQGHAPAQALLGQIYEKGVGVDRDYKQAMEWYKRSADKKDAEGQYRLGQMQFNGRGGTRDEGAAIELFKKAADQGHSGSKYRLGEIYWNGDGAKKNRRQAKEWFAAALASYREAANLGNSDAQLKLAWMYDGGHSVKKNARGATQWYRKAADQGIPEAQWQMGERYARGDGVRQDQNEAVKWYLASAEQGFAEAQYSLGLIYKKRKNLADAAAQFRLAADQGHSGAIQALRQMRE